MNRIENDYLPCKEYLVNGEITPEGYVLFQNLKNKLYYFALKDSKGDLLFKSEGYPTNEARMLGINSVKKNLKKKENYEIIEKNKKYMTVLFANNNQEIARSCWFDNKKEFEKSFPNLKHPTLFPPILMWIALPLLALISFLLGKLFSDEILINNQFEKKDIISKIEASFRPIDLYFEKNTPQDSIFKRTLYSDLNSQYLKKECDYLYYNKENREKCKDFFAKIRYGNLKFNEQISNLANNLKFNKIDSIQFLVNKPIIQIGLEKDIEDLNRKRIELLSNSIKNILSTNEVGKIIIKVVSNDNHNTLNVSQLINSTKSVYSVEELNKEKLEIAGIKIFKKNIIHESPSLVKSDTTYLSKFLIFLFTNLKIKI